MIEGAAPNCRTTNERASRKRMYCHEDNRVVVAHNLRFSDYGGVGRSTASDGRTSH